MQKGASQNIQAEPLPDLNTKSMGHPQLRSTKSTLLPISFAMTSAVGTSVFGLFPATCTPNIDSEGCRLTSDHSSLEPDKKDVAKPTSSSHKRQLEKLYVK